VQFGVFIILMCSVFIYSGFQAAIFNKFELSSSAVAKRPRDVSCLSVVSFSSTKRRALSFTVS